jgi:probable F420-dependent oxidoreductase
VQLGIVFPESALDTERAVVSRYLTSIDDAGFDYVLGFDHVLAPVTTSGWRRFSGADPIREPFTLFAFMAGLTRLGAMFGVLVLPQRQTVLVAKQAAELDWYLEGSLRLGVGIGWNQLEYQALGVEMADRGARLEEQVAVMRALWSEEVVSFDGRFHTIEQGALNPRPRSGRIPVWIGTQGRSAAVLERIGRIADGWVPLLEPGPELDDAIAIVRRSAEAAGRDPDAIGLEGAVYTGGELDRDAIRRVLDAWIALGASHVSLDPSRTDPLKRFDRTSDEQLAIIDELRDVVADATPRDARARHVSVHPNPDRG